MVEPSSGVVVWEEHIMEQSLEVCVKQRLGSFATFLPQVASRLPLLQLKVKAKGVGNNGLDQVPI